MPTSQDSPLLHLNFSAVSTFIASQGDFEYVSRLVNTLIQEFALTGINMLENHIMLARN